MKLALVGSRKHTQVIEVCLTIKKAILFYEPTLVISGGADGTDTWAVDTAKSLGIDTFDHLPTAKTWACFKARNMLIAEHCDALVAFCSRSSKTHGAEWTYRYAKTLGKEAHIRWFD